jgi:hypothetical protein
MSKKKLIGALVDNYNRQVAIANRNGVKNQMTLEEYLRAIENASPARPAANGQQQKRGRR